MTNDEQSHRTPPPKFVSHYDASYGHFGESLYGEIRSEVFGEDIGQNGWLTAAEQDQFVEWLKLGPESRLLDIACGSGGPTLRIAERTRAAVHGIDVHEAGIAAAIRQAGERGLSPRATFERVDGSRPLRYRDASFDAVMCIDAINHLPDRPRVLLDWSRVLRPAGRILFTDPIVVTGQLTSEEIAIRSSIGFFIFVPPLEDDRLVEAAGLKIEIKEDVTENMALTAQRWHDARAARESALRGVEGDETYEGQQRFFHVAAQIAAQRRLSRFVYVATKNA
jgi:SAM-dependent methyltransferase